MRPRSGLALLLCAAGVAGAAPPAALSGVSAGLWELSGIPGTHAPVRQCISDVMALAEVEHRGRHCSRTVVSDSGSSAVINYSCGAAGFGHSQLDVLTPRSLRISTQGISGQLPFNYTVQAHRVAECEKVSPTHH